MTFNDEQLLKILTALDTHIIEFGADDDFVILHDSVKSHLESKGFVVTGE